MTNFCQAILIYDNNDVGIKVHTKILLKNDWCFQKMHNMNEFHGQDNNLSSFYLLLKKPLTNDFIHCAH